MDFTAKLKKHIFLTTSLLILFVFIAGILVGSSLETGNSQKITQYIKDNELNTESYLVEQELIKSFGENNCGLAQTRIDELSVELGNIGRKLSADDAKQKLGEVDYNLLKRRFHLMQIRTYILFKKLIDSCDIPSDIILYYYSFNDPDSTEQGHILDTIVNDYDAKVFAIEYGYSKELEFLESYYHVKATPSIIVNYGEMQEGLVSYDDIADEMIGEKNIEEP